MVGGYLVCRFAVWALVLGSSGYALVLHSGSKLCGGCSCRLSCNRQLGILLGYCKARCNKRVEWKWKTLNQKLINKVWHSGMQPSCSSTLQSIWVHRKGNLMTMLVSIVYYISYRMSHSRSYQLQSRLHVCYTISYTLNRSISYNMHCMFYRQSRLMTKHNIGWTDPSGSTVYRVQGKLTC